MAKAMDDAILALFQNGERLRPRTAIPCACSCPAGKHMSVKWLGAQGRVGADHDQGRDVALHGSTSDGSR